MAKAKEPKIEKTEDTIIEEVKPQFREEDLNTELLNVDDIMGRTMVQYFLLGETAKSIKEGGPLRGDKIEIGTLARRVTPEVISVLNQYVNDANMYLDSDGFTYISATGVPVECKFIHNDYPFFENPDFEFYYATEYNLPNPFDRYWNMRGIIQ